MLHPRDMRNNNLEGTLPGSWSALTALEVMCVAHLHIAICHIEMQLILMTLHCSRGSLGWSVS